MIPFNVPFESEKQREYLSEVFLSKKFSGDGSFTKKCHSWLEQALGAPKVLLTTSCSHALEMSAILADIKPGDEVIMPSFTFVSTANAFVLRGATIVFVDINPVTMNIDETKIESAITPQTRAIVPVHYGGVSCDMDAILSIAKKHNLLVIEDAAQCFGSYYKGQPVGVLGDMSCFSFHETKNIHSGEGGALVLNTEKFTQRAEIIREKGTNRSMFLRGQVDKYTWVDMGSSYLPSELLAAVLYAQLEVGKEITEGRLKTWNLYNDLLAELETAGFIELPKIPADCQHNGHIFFVKLQDIEARQGLIDYLQANGVSSVFHYIPLHSAIAGLKYGRFHGLDEHTTKESERLLRLPMFSGLEGKDVVRITDLIKHYFKQDRG